MFGDSCFSVNFKFEFLLKKHLRTQFTKEGFEKINEVLKILINNLNEFVLEYDKFEKFNMN